MEKTTCLEGTRRLILVGKTKIYETIREGMVTNLLVADDCGKRLATIECGWPIANRETTIAVSKIGKLFADFSGLAVTLPASADKIWHGKEVTLDARFKIAAIRKGPYYVGLDLFEPKQWRHTAVVTVHFSAALSGGDDTKRFMARLGYALL